MKQKINTIGVYGGSFDPIHIGHLRFAQLAIEYFSLEKILFIPAYNLPHTYKDKVSDFKLRVKLISKAIEDNDKFELSEIESKREDKSYTIDTLRELNIIYPNAKLFFLMGSDSFLMINTWKNWKTLLNEYSHIVAVRPGYTLKKIEEFAKSFNLKYETISERKIGNFYNEHLSIKILTDSSILDISSTDIRKRLKEGRDIRYLVPEKVYNLIISENLYREEKFG